MLTSHLQTLEEKHENLEEAIREEMAHPARSEGTLRHLKKEKLFLKEQIERLRQTGT